MSADTISFESLAKVAQELKSSPFEAYVVQPDIAYRLSQEIPTSPPHLQPAVSAFFGTNIYQKRGQRKAAWKFTDRDTLLFYMRGIITEDQLEAMEARNA